MKAKDGRIFLRGRIWHIEYYADKRHIKESTRSARRAAAEALLERRVAEARQAGLKK